MMGKKEFGDEAVDIEGAEEAGLCFAAGSSLAAIDGAAE